MARVRTYYADQSLSAAFYDTVTAADGQLAGDIDIYAGLIPTGGSVLEFGAGTGRIAAALAVQGFNVTGVDLAPAMLTQAQARRATLPEDVAARLELRQGDMTSVRLGRSFDAVICTFFTLAHVPAGTAWRNTFQVTARHLKPGGLAAFHLPMREQMRRVGEARTEPPAVKLPTSDGRILRLQVGERRFRDDIGKMEQLVDYAELAASGQVLRSSTERMTFYIADPVPLAATAGLVLDRPPIPVGVMGEIFVFRHA